MSIIVIIKNTVGTVSVSDEFINNYYNRVLISTSICLCRYWL